MSTTAGTPGARVSAVLTTWFPGQVTNTQNMCCALLPQPCGRYDMNLPHPCGRYNLTRARLCYHSLQGAPGIADVLLGDVAPSGEQQTGYTGVRAAAECAWWS